MIGKSGKCPGCGYFKKLNANGKCTDCRPQPIKGNRTTVKDVITTLKRQAIQRKRKVTGELEMFKEIASERPYVCFVTGTPILKLSVWNCAHVLSKGSFPAFRLKKENIVLVQQWVHDIYDRGDRTKLEKYEGYHNLIALAEELKTQYYKENKVRRIE